MNAVFADNFGLDPGAGTSAVTMGPADLADSLAQVIPIHPEGSTRPDSASHLERMFPRIAEKIAAQWDNPFAASRYLDGLLIDDRGNRQGFPLEVLDEIAFLSRLLLSSGRITLEDALPRRPSGFF